MDIIKISKDLHSYLKKNQNKTLMVHSVFSESVNLISDKGELVTLLSKNKDIAPMSALVNWDRSFIENVSRGDNVVIKPESLRFSGRKVSLHFISAEIWDKRLLAAANYEYRTGKAAVDMLRHALVVDGAKEGILPLINVLEFDGHVSLSEDDGSLNEYCCFIKDRIYSFLCTVARKDMIHAVEILPDFIGFGPGLTPSTDDFLVGVITSLCSVSDEYNDFTNKIYEASLGKTTIISESMLRHAKNCIVADSYFELIEALNKNDVNNLESKIKRVLDTGSTSGSDFLLGVYCMRKIQMNIFKEDMQ